jgi:hypothetical protein
MGESPSQRTERELADLRARIDADVTILVDRVREDLDPRALARRNPLAVFGTLGSVGLLGAARVIASVRAARSRRSESEIDRMLSKLGSRADRLKGRARKRLRERLRAEMDEAQKPDRIKEAAWTAGLSALTAGAATLARRFAGRIAMDD